MSFLDDIEDEHHRQAIESGNLRPKPREVPFETQWTSLGYVARVQRNRCVCGGVNDIFHGIFHRQQSKAGSIRDEHISTRGLQIPLGQTHRIEVTEFPVQLCLTCLPAKGFKESQR